MAAKKKKVLDFTMQPQEQFAWCWAAVGTSCALFYDPNSGWTQCKVASKSIVPAPGNCCGANASGFKCNLPWPLLNKDNQGSFVTTHIPSRFVEGAIPVQTLIEEINKGQLLAYRLEIKLDHEIDIIPGPEEKLIPGFWHFVVIAGYQFSGPVNDQNVTVYVHDPFSLEKGYSTMTYEVFQKNYQCHGGAISDLDNHPDQQTNCKITHTFFTSPILNA